MILHLQSKYSSEAYMAKCVEAHRYSHDLLQQRVDAWQVGERPTPIGVSENALLARLNEKIEEVSHWVMLSHRPSICFRSSKRLTLACAVLVLYMFWLQPPTYATNEHRTAPIVRRGSVSILVCLRLLIPVGTSMLYLPALPCMLLV